MHSQQHPQKSSWRRTTEESHIPLQDSVHERPIHTSGTAELHSWLVVTVLEILSFFQITNLHEEI